jgi:hypothetical protein
MPQDDHWLPGFNVNVEEWDAKGQSYETLAICRTLGLARARGRRHRPIEATIAVNNITTCLGYYFTTCGRPPCA